MEIVSNAELREYIAQLAERLEAIPTGLARILSDHAPQVYFTKQEAADYLRLSPSSVDRLVSAGKLRRAKFGEGSSAVLFRREDLDQCFMDHVEVDQRTAQKMAREFRRRLSGQ